jgi:hypothetical protein
LPEEKTEETKDGLGCFGIGLIVVLIVIVVAFGLLVGVCGLKL